MKGSVILDVSNIKFFYAESNERHKPVYGAHFQHSHIFLQLNSESSIDSRHPSFAGERVSSIFRNPASKKAICKPSKSKKTSSRTFIQLIGVA